MAQEHTSKCLSCLFSFIASYMYVGSNVGSNESTTLSSFFSSSALDVPPAAGGDCCWVDGVSSTINSLRNLTVASTSGVAPAPVSGSSGLRCHFISPSSLNRFQNGGEFTSSCRTAFVKHIFLIFTSPRARRRGSVALLVGREAGMEIPMEGGGKWEELERDDTCIVRLGCWDRCQCRCR